MSGILEVADNTEGTSVKPTPEQLYARGARSIALTLTFGVIVLVIFAVTIVRFSSGALVGPDYMRPVEAIGRI